MNTIHIATLVDFAEAIESGKKLFYTNGLPVGEKTPLGDIRNAIEMKRIIQSPWTINFEDYRGFLPTPILKEPIKGSLYYTIVDGRASVKEWTDSNADWRLLTTGFVWYTDEDANGFLKGMKLLVAHVAGVPLRKSNAQ
ncbi:MAG: hypothetical protein OEX12_00260 [Gammaproteobacteria bacterium]|nr:hypothetical protein [Gammaproteobacteria bacterium]